MILVTRRFWKALRYAFSAAASRQNPRGAARPARRVSLGVESLEERAVPAALPLGNPLAGAGTALHASSRVSPTATPGFTDPFGRNWQVASFINGKGYTIAVDGNGTMTADDGSGSGPQVIATNVKQWYTTRGFGIIALDELGNLRDNHTVTAGGWHDRLGGVAGFQIQDANDVQAIAFGNQTWGVVANVTPTGGDPGVIPE